MKLKFFLHHFSVHWRTGMINHYPPEATYIWIQTEKESHLGYTEGTLSVQLRPTVDSLQGWHNYTYKKL